LILRNSDNDDTNIFVVFEYLDKIDYEF
jgi:hypothetical protein